MSHRRLLRIARDYKNVTVGGSRIKVDVEVISKFCCRSNEVELFRDNWSYLKVEINWLERILLNAAAKMRKTEATTARFAKTKADRATHSWWEGLVTFEKVGYDSPPAAAPKSLSYQQQLDLRISASQTQGIPLALPALCDRHNLSLFEKQTILLALAPEVHRRYGELCGYLTGQDQVSLPNVDLALRLFCRDDRTWRQNRSQLQSGPLIQHTILLSSDRRHQSFLESPLKLSPPIVNTLLAEHPTPQTSQVFTPQRPILNAQCSIPPVFHRALDQLQSSTSQAAQWIGLDRFLSLPEKIDLYHHLATALNLSIVILDVSTLTEAEQSQILQPISSPIQGVSPTLLVITSAQRWLSRSGTLKTIQIRPLIQQFSADYTWIIFDLPYPIALSQVWRSWITLNLGKK